MSCEYVIDCIPPLSRPIIVPSDRVDTIPLPDGLSLSVHGPARTLTAMFGTFVHQFVLRSGASEPISFPFCERSITVRIRDAEHSLAAIPEREKA